MIIITAYLFGMHVKLISTFILVWTESSGKAFLILQIPPMLIKGISGRRCQLPSESPRRFWRPVANISSGSIFLTLSNWTDPKINLRQGWFCCHDTIGFFLMAAYKKILCSNSNSNFSKTYPESRSRNQIIHVQPFHMYRNFSKYVPAI